jgi:hypothetical protein
VIVEQLLEVTDRAAANRDAHLMNRTLAGVAAASWLVDHVLRIEIHLLVRRPEHHDFDVAIDDHLRVRDDVRSQAQLDNAHGAQRSRRVGRRRALKIRYGALEPARQLLFAQLIR